MKYAVINPRGGVNRISENAITGNPEGTTVVELTDEQAAQVETGRTATPRVFYLWHDNALITVAERQAALQAERLAERAAMMTPEEKIGLAKAHVARTFDAFDLISMMDKLAQVKEADALAANPKLAATYTWIQTVQGMAVAGQTEFPPAPHTFLEVRAEPTPEP